MGKGTDSRISCRISTGEQERNAKAATRTVSRRLQPHRIGGVIMKMYVVDAETGAIIQNRNRLMKEAGLTIGLGFEEIGIQSDGTPVVFDRCGNFGYLDINKYHVVIDMNAE